MMQGDSYGIEAKLFFVDGKPIDNYEVKNVEIVIGSLRKTSRDNEVYYDPDLESWIFPIKQEESFEFPVGRLKAQVRVVWPNGDVEGAELEDVHVIESRSKTVLPRP